MHPLSRWAALGAAGLAAAAFVRLRWRGWLLLGPAPDSRFTKEQFFELLALKGSETYALLTILKEEKGFHFHFYSDPAVPDVVIIMVQCVYDHVLLRLARVGFPRGFPIVWNTATNDLTFYGFLPKFANDDRATRSSELQSASRLKVCKKFSGFLSMCIALPLPKAKGWLGIWRFLCHGPVDFGVVCTSKNSANCGPRKDSLPVFPKEGARLFSPHLSLGLVRHMAANRISLCAEMMSRHDQVHGARVLRETPIVTAVCRGSVNAWSGDTVFDDVPFPRVFSAEELQLFCRRFRLPWSGCLEVAGEAVDSLMHLLEGQRDMMTNECFDSIRVSLEEQHPQHVRAFPGTPHDEVLGDVLEGLVIFAEGADGRRVLKYKFPGYVLRTMGLRTAATEARKKQLSLATFAEEWASKLVSRWCVSDEGRARWLRRLQYAMFLKETAGESFRDPLVARHILIMDHVAACGVPDDFHGFKLTTRWLFLVLGLADRGGLCAKMRESAEELGLAAKVLDAFSDGWVKGMRARTDSLEKAIFEALRQHDVLIASIPEKVAVHKNMLAIREKIGKAIPGPVKIIACLPGPSKDHEISESSIADAYTQDAESLRGSSVELDDLLAQVPRYIKEATVIFRGADATIPWFGGETMLTAVKQILLAKE